MEQKLMALENELIEIDLKLTEFYLISTLLNF